MKTIIFFNVCGGDTQVPREAIGHWVSPQITSPPYCLRKGLSQKLQLIDSARLACQELQVYHSVSVP